MRQMFCYTPESKGAQTSAQEKNQCKVRGAHSEVVRLIQSFLQDPFRRGNLKELMDTKVCVCAGRGGMRE